MFEPLFIHFSIGVFGRFDATSHVLGRNLDFIVGDLEKMVDAITSPTKVDEQ
jgi:hypothetical protein